MPPNPDGAPKGGHGRYSSVNGAGAPVVSPQDSAFVGSDGGWGVLGRGLMCQAVACVLCDAGNTHMYKLPPNVVRCWLLLWMRFVFLLTSNVLTSGSAPLSLSLR